VDVLSIHPFIDSVHDVFDSMLGCEVHLKETRTLGSGAISSDIIGVIGLSGTAQGVVAVRLPEKTALAVIGKMVGAEFTTVDFSIIDGVGELVNIVAGSAKGRLKGHSISVSLPTVVKGDIYRLSNLHNALWLEVCFESSLGEFAVIVTLKQVANQQQEVVSEGANSR